MSDRKNRELLRTTRPDLLRRAVEIGSIADFNRGRSEERTASEVESAVVQLICSILEEVRRAT